MAPSPTGKTAMDTALYSTRNISKSFGATRALAGVEIDIHAGRITGLLGANGAGKSTLMKILSGALQPDGGELVFEGRPFHMGSMQEAWQRGVAFVSQELNLFPALSVGENLWLVPGRAGLIPTRDFLRKAKAQTEALGLSVAMATPVDTLSLADRQLVEIARALLQSPRVLILDEPTSALQAAEVHRLHAILRRLRDTGVAIIYISHFLEEVLEVVDDVIVIRDGANVALPAGRPTVPQIVEAMLGRAPSPLHPADLPATATGAAGGKTLTISGLETGDGLRIESLVAREGEVVGIAGLAGAGTDALIEVLFGMRRPTAGTIALPSGKGAPASRAEAVRNGVAYFPSDRKRLGLTLQQSIHENISAVRSLALGRDGPVPNVARQRETARDRAAEIGIKFANVDDPVSTLSGGNQQKVVFARWLEAAPDLLLLDDPMRGVDVNAKREMYRIIRGLAERDRIILFQSTDLGDYVACADRVLVFARGRIIDELKGSRLNEHELTHSMNEPG